MEYAIYWPKLQCMKDKLFKMTIIDENGKTWNDVFATKLQTEIAALNHARRMFPDCAIVPARFIKTKYWFWFGAAVGFAIAFALVAFFIPLGDLINYFDWP